MAAAEWVAAVVPDTPRSTVNVFPLIAVIYICSVSIKMVWAGPRSVADETLIEVAVVDVIASHVVTSAVDVVYPHDPLIAKVCWPPLSVFDVSSFNSNMVFGVWLYGISQ